MKQLQVCCVYLALAISVQSAIGQVVVVDTILPKREIQNKIKEILKLESPDSLATQYLGQAADRLKLDNYDSSFSSELNTANASILHEINSTLESTVRSLRNKTHTALIPPGLDKDIIKKFSRFEFKGLLFNMESSKWDLNGKAASSIEGCVSSELMVFGIPIDGSLNAIQNNQEETVSSRITFHFNYKRETFIRNIKIDEDKIKQGLTKELDFKKQINPTDKIKDSYLNNSTINKVLSISQADVNDVLNMSAEQFKKKYNPQNLKAESQKITRLRKYYTDYIPKSAFEDSIIKEKKNALDSQETKLREKSEAYTNLFKLKADADSLQDKVGQICKSYQSEVEKVIKTYNEIKALRESKDLSGFQKAMLNIKGLQIGQHNLATGNLVLKNFLQNGISLEYESDKLYCLITKGSQNGIQLPVGYSASSNHSGLNEFYHYSNKYNLTGVSIGRGKKDQVFQQVSLMSFGEISSDFQNSQSKRIIDVVTYGFSYGKPKSKIVYDISKSIVRSERNSVDQSSNRIFDSYALFVKAVREVRNSDRQNLKLRLADPTYYNPGLNGGLSRPGIEGEFEIFKSIGKLRITNLSNYYSLKYNNSISILSARDKLQLSYKFKDIRVGMLINSNFINQIQYNPKISTKIKSGDFLVTSQSQKKIGKFNLDLNGGAGYGFSKQINYGNTFNYSYFINSNINHKNWLINTSFDKFNTKNTEVFLTDSSAFVLLSSFNLDANIGYAKNSNLVQFGISFKELNAGQKYLFITGESEWELSGKVRLWARVSLPLRNPSDKTLFVNNTFNSKFIYNLSKYEK